MSADLIEGEVSAHGRRVAIVAARFNDFIVASLLKGARAAWLERGGSAHDLTVVRVPGAFELPVVVRRLAASGRFDAVVALGCGIRGDTPHFDYVAGEAASGLQLAAIETGVPVAFGVLTVETVEQAEARIDRAADAVRTALEMADVFAQLRASARA